MKTYCYVEYGHRGVIEKTEIDIYKEYFPYWCFKIIDVRGFDYFRTLTFENCIQDWIVVNWAWEKNDERI